MTLAIGAIFLAIILTPPLLGIYFYSKGNHAKSFPKFTLLEYLLISSVLSLLVHGSIIKILGLRIDYLFIYNFISGQNNSISLEKNQVEKYFFDFFGYILIVSFFTSSFGYMLKIIATNRKLRTFSLLQKLRNNARPNGLFSYYNNWWYLFRANEYDSNLNFDGKYQFVIIDVLVDVKDSSVLYSGVLKDFTIYNQQLDCIYLLNAEKRLFTSHDNNNYVTLKEGQVQEIFPEDNNGIFCIPYSKIINLHIRFVDLPATNNLDFDRVIQTLSNDEITS